MQSYPRHDKIGVPRDYCFEGTLVASMIPSLVIVAALLTREERIMVPRPPQLMSWRISAGYLEGVMGRSP